MRLKPDTRSAKARLGQPLRLKSDTRVALVRFGCVVLAAYVAWPLFGIDPPRNPPDLLSPVAQHVRVHAPRPKAVVAATREKVIIKSKKAPSEKLIVKKQVAVKPTPEVVTPPVVSDPAPVQGLQPISEVPQLVLTQPGLPSKAALPPVPPDDLPSPQHFYDKPGGSVVILGVKLNSDNVAVMTDILVASNTPLNDLALAMTTRGVKWTQVDPPIPPGEYRWVEVRLDYASGPDKSILP